MLETALLSHIQRMHAFNQQATLNFGADSTHQNAGQKQNARMVF